MKRKQARPTAKIPSRTHSSDKSEAATGLSTPGSDPEPREALPLRQEEDLEHSTAEHRGEEAGPVHVSVWGGGGCVRADMHLRSFWEQKFEWAEAAAILARHSSPAGLADGHCHSTASHWIWPVRRNTPSTSPLPVRPSAGSR